MFFCFCLLFSVSFLFPNNGFVTGEVVGEFVSLDYDWPNASMRQDFIQSGQYDPKANVFTSIQVYTDVKTGKRRIFVAVPRSGSAKGVPSGLNEVVNSTSGRPQLRPYPGWDAISMKTCSSLIFPMGMAINPNTGHMYVIDTGRVAISTKHPVNLCPAQIVVFDLKTDMIVHYYDFPNEVVNRSSNFLNDIVLDHVVPKRKNPQFAYITDPYDEKIVVYDIKSDSSWYFHDPSSMGTDEDRQLITRGKEYSVDVGVDGIAISSSFNFLYYCSIGSKILWQIPTWVLRDKTSDFIANRRSVGEKPSQTGGMIAGQKGIYFGALAMDAVFVWNRKDDVKDLEDKATINSLSVVDRNWEILQWADGFSIDSTGTLYFTTNRLHRFNKGELDFTGKNGANFRILAYRVNDLPYNFWK